MCRYVFSFCVLVINDSMLTIILNKTKCKAKWEKDYSHIKTKICNKDMIK